MKDYRHYPLLLLCWLIHGCDSLQSVTNPIDLIRLDQLMALHESMASADLETKQSIAIEVIGRQTEPLNTQDTLKRAIVKAVPGHSFSDNNGALLLLQKLEPQALSISERRVWEWLSSQLHYRLALQGNVEELNRTVSSLREALSRAEEKLEILTRIERTVGPGATP